MDPLSPFTYYRRHRRQALLLVGLVTLVTLGLYTMVGVLDSIPENTLVTNNSLTRFSLVYFLGPTDVSQIRTHPDVAHVILEKGVYIEVPSLAMTESFRLLGIPEDDLQLLMDICDVRLKEGRLLRRRTNELVLSEEIASALGLRVGDRIGRSVNARYYKYLPTEFVLVGILESTATGSGPSIRVGFVSYEYMDSHELYMHQPLGLIVIAHEGRKAAVDDFLETSILSPHTDVRTYGRMVAFYNRVRGMLYLVFGIMDCLVAAVAALVVGAINRIALAQRLEEFGLLHAIGYDEKQLIRRVTLETAVMAGIGWLTSLMLAWLAFAWLKTNFYNPRGMEINQANLTPLWFTVPIPLAVIGSVASSITRVFARLDPVVIIERGKLSMEAGEHQPRTKSLARPLSSRTFYLRHHRRGVTLVVATALMILSVALPVFLFLPMQDTQKLLIEHLRHVSVVSARDGSIDPGVAAQIRTHPSVAGVVPTNPLLLAVSVPPLLQAGIRLYSVPEEYLQDLLDLYGLELEEGQLPRSRSNEVVISKAVALNRGLRVGDKVGRPVYEQDGFPTEMVITGILQPRPGKALSLSDPWVGFSSYEYQQAHESYASEVRYLLVIPAEGRKAEMDAWLEGNVASTYTAVETYDTQLCEIQQTTQNMLLLFAIVESVIAAVAAIALAVLNYIFFSQRREEFGILNAIGYNRAWLVLRTVRETVSVVALAWLIGAVVCGANLVLFQIGLYAPKGLRVDFANVGPWLFTIPIPLAVVVVSAGTIARVLSKLDPVSIIERRV